MSQYPQFKPTTTERASLGVRTVLTISEEDKLYIELKYGKIPAETSFWSVTEFFDKLPIPFRELSTVNKAYETRGDLLDETLHQLLDYERYVSQNR